MKKGKFLGVSSNLLTVIFGALIFVLMMAPFLTIVSTSSVVQIKDVNYSFYSFFEKEEISMFVISIVCVLCAGIVVSLCSLLVTILCKKKKNLVVLLNVLTGLVFVGLAICLFIFKAVEGSNESLGIGSFLLTVSMKLGYGAVLGGIAALIAGFIEVGSGLVLLTKKK